jgi:hypothetical protein
VDCVGTLLLPGPNGSARRSLEHVSRYAPYREPIQQPTQKRQYEAPVGRRIGSAALVADGLHARTEGSPPSRCWSARWTPNTASSTPYPRLTAALVHADPHGDDRTTRHGELAHHR